MDSSSMDFDENTRSVRVRQSLQCREDFAAPAAASFEARDASPYLEQFAIIAQLGELSSLLHIVENTAKMASFPASSLVEVHSCAQRLSFRRITKAIIFQL